MDKTSTIRKMTSKGQVTLPARWRKRIGTDTVLVIDNGVSLEIKPAEIITGEEVLFDAKIDNDGKGIPINDLIKALEGELK